MSLSVCGCAKFSFRKNETKFGLEHLVVGSGCELYVNSLARGRALFYTRVFNKLRWEKSNPGQTRANEKCTRGGTSTRRTWTVVKPSRANKSFRAAPAPYAIYYTTLAHTHTHNSPSLVLTEELIHSRWHKNHIHVINTHRRHSWQISSFFGPKVPTPTIHNGVEEMFPKLFFIFPLLNPGRGFTMAAKLGWGAEAEEAHSCD